MTFLKTRFTLKKEPTPTELDRLARLSTVYGIREIAIEGQDLVVEYDASRIHEAEALSDVRRTGVAVDPARQIQAGSFDYAGEFRDFAWPTQGLSPANLKVK